MGPCDLSGWRQADRRSVRRARGGADGLSDWALPEASGGAGRSRLVHRGGEKPSNRCITEPTKAKMLHLSEACCGDLSLTVAAVKLVARDGLDVGAEMFRGWLLAKSPAHFQRHERPSLAWRARRVHVGELIPLDWSPHDWVEGAAGPVSGWRILLMPLVGCMPGSMTMKDDLDHGRSPALCNVLRVAAGRLCR